MQDNNKARRIEGVRALLNPKNVAIVGASDRPGNWAANTYRSLTRHGFPGKIYPVNPRNETVWDQKCYPSLSALPEPPDHVVVVVPGKAAIETIREAGRAGARSAQILSSGFGEGGDPQGIALGEELSRVIAESGVAVAGPNCMGNMSVPGQMMSVNDDRVTELKAGPVAVFGQSGGVVMAIVRAMRGRGLYPSYGLTAGNEIDINVADYIRYFAQDPQVRVLACYIEAIKNPEDFRDACATAQKAGKPVVALKIGGSEASRVAALAHTGSLAGSLACFDAVAGPLGVIRVDTLDEMVETTEYLAHATPPKGTRVGAMTFSGGLKGLILEAAERNNIELPELAPETTEKLTQVLGVGTSLGNPIDAGFAALSSAEAYFKCVEILQADPNFDVLLLQEELPQVARANNKIENLKTVDKMVASGTAKPIAVLSMASYMYSDFTREFRALMPHLPMLHEVDKGMKAVRAAGVYGRQLARGNAAPKRITAKPDASVVAGLVGKADVMEDGRRVLNEASSKKLLELYGINSPKESVAASADAAAAAADSIGYPVVLKVVSPQIQHKSDVGGVLVGVKDAADVRDGFARIKASLAQHAPQATFEGVIVAQMVSGGVECVLGVQRDPEVGPVVMFGTGGVLLELQKDVAFGPVPLSLDQARDMIASTKVSKLLAGYRGAPPCDVESIAKAIVALSELTHDMGDQVESIDINPFVALPKGQSAVALDGLVVLRAK
jgi:acyl-CoA synthetase (NDP forming)